MLYLRLLSATSKSNSASAIRVFRGTRKLATIDGATVTMHRTRTEEERTAVLDIAGERDRAGGRRRRALAGAGLLEAHDSLNGYPSIQRMLCQAVA